MTLHELAVKDMKKARINLERAKQRPNVPTKELEHLEELLKLREELVLITLSKSF